MPGTIARILLTMTLIDANVVAGERPALAHVIWDIDFCMSCHRPDQQKQIAARLARPCRELCQTCHPAPEGHHPVGITVPAPVRAPLLLTREGTNTCSTCHDVTQPRTDRVPWLSQSLFQRLAGRSNTYRTQYLAMRNHRGQLCRNCH